jgi:hypothetical protein
MTGTDYTAWNDPVKGGEIAKSQIAQGADVSITPLAAPASAFSRLPPKPASSASVSTPTRTACSRARC